MTSDILVSCVCLNRVLKTEWLKARKCILSSSVGQKSTVKASAGLVPSEGCEGETSSGTLLSAG